MQEAPLTRHAKSGSISTSHALSLLSFFSSSFSTSTLKLTFYKGEAFLYTLKALDHMQSSITHKLEDQKFQLQRYGNLFFFHLTKTKSIKPY